MKPPPLRPLLPPPAIRRRRRQKNFSLISSCSAFTPIPFVSTYSSSVPGTTYSPSAHLPTYFPAIHRPNLSPVHRTRPSDNARQARHYAIQTPGPLTLQVFNIATKHRQRERAASNAEISRRVDYLRDEVATRLCERLLVYFPESCFSLGSVGSLYSFDSIGHGHGNLVHQTPLPTYP